ncbi:MAG TPA: V-type ATP synthase subunit I [Tepidimicrobium sp.]|nr:V-type ATP synthase subunit I [Tepidimicrobium sp.]
MAIVKMSSFNLFAFDSNRDDLLHELQKFEYVHFEDLEEAEDLKDEGLKSVTVPESMVEIDDEIAKVRHAIDILRRYHSEETGLKAMMEGKPSYTFKELEEKALKVDYLSAYEDLKELASKVDRIEEEENQLNALKEELEHWIKLDYPIKDLKAFEQSKVFVGTLPIKLGDKLDEELADLEYSHVEIISEDDENRYLFALTSKDEADKLYEVLRSSSFSVVDLVGDGTPREEIDSIDLKLEQLAEEKGKIEDSIIALLKHLSEFEVVYEYLVNKKLRLSASENFLATEKVNLIKGYIPMDMEGDFRKTIESSGLEAYYLEIEEVDRDDPNVPVLLENSKFAEVFESLTNMYALPRYNEVDPTPLLAPFYLVFFGMMVADMAYGLIMLIATSIVLKKANLEEDTRNFIKFFFYLSFSVIAWGALYGSFFGDLIPIKGLVDPAEQYQSILMLSIFFGLIHLFFGLGINAYMHIRDRRYLDAFADAGVWYMSLTGAIGLILSMYVPVPAVLLTISKWVMIAGLVGIVLTGGKDVEGIGAKIGVGIYELYGISGYVGDFVSYSRLMALALSGGFIAAAVNMIAGMLFEIGVIGVIFGIIVIIFGQSLNIFLSLLGAYVHTSRLIYVEFFGKFYEGGGKRFNLFRSKPEFINLK